MVYLPCYRHIWIYVCLAYKGFYGKGMGYKMEERRKNKRSSLSSRIVIKKLDGKGSRSEVQIEIQDISKTGIGFDCAEPLQIGEVYEAYLTIWTKEVLHAFLQIVRIELKSGGYSYGAIFIGMPEMDSARIETYQTVSENAK